MSSELSLVNDFKTNIELFNDGILPDEIYRREKAGISEVVQTLLSEFDRPEVTQASIDQAFYGFDYKSIISRTDNLIEVEPRHTYVYAETQSYPHSLHTWCEWIGQIGVVELTQKENNVFLEYAQVDRSNPDIIFGSFLRNHGLHRGMVLLKKNNPSRFKIGQGNTLLKNPLYELLVSPSKRRNKGLVTQYSDTPEAISPYNYSTIQQYIEAFNILKK